MTNGFSKCVVALCALSLGALCPNPMHAQSGMSGGDKEKPVMYTYVAEWAVNRADWPAMEKVDAASNQTMAKLLADGTITGYGTFKSLVHQEGRPTHGDWWSASSMANLMKALSATSGQTAASDEVKVLAGAKHWDFIMESHQYGSHSGTFDNCYLRVANWKIKQGEDESAEKAIKGYLVPILEKLLADGSIHAYSVDSEAIHTDDPGEVDVVLFANGAEGLDKFGAALDAASKANPFGAPAFGSSVDVSAHRDSLSLATSTFK